MDGYEKRFNNAVEMYKRDADKYNFINFRSCTGIFGFIVNNDKNPDGEALTIAYLCNKDIFLRLFATPKPKLGYASNPDWYSQCDNLDSRHIMMSTFIFDILTKIKELDKIHYVVEIGGGFGNWPRLNRGIIPYSKWSIVDLYHISKLQEWYLKQTMDTDYNKIELVTTDDYSKWVDTVEKVDLVIGSHSLSELSLDAFKNYCDTILRKTRFLFYAHHKELPHPFLIHDKKKLLEEIFYPIVVIPSEKGQVFNIMYKSKLVK